VTIDDVLKWSTHVNTICSKASSRLHFLKVLKRAHCQLVTYCISIPQLSVHYWNMHALHEIHL